MVLLLGFLDKLFTSKAMSQLYELGYPCQKTYPEMIGFSGDSDQEDNPWTEPQGVQLAGIALLWGRIDDQGVYHYGIWKMKVDFYGKDVDTVIEGEWREVTRPNKYKNSGVESRAAIPYGVTVNAIVTYFKHDMISGFEVRATGLDGTPQKYPVFVQNTSVEQNNEKGFTAISDSFGNGTLATVIGYNYYRNNHNVFTGIGWITGAFPYRVEYTANTPSTTPATDVSYIVASSSHYRYDNTTGETIDITYSNTLTNFIRDQVIDEKTTGTSKEVSVAFGVEFTQTFPLTGTSGSISLSKQTTQIVSLEETKTTSKMVQETSSQEATIATTLAPGKSKIATLEMIALANPLTIVTQATEATYYWFAADGGIYSEDFSDLPIQFQNFDSTMEMRGYFTDVPSS
jgi:hypothetical protein